MMNKLMGFYELKNMQLPSIPWKEYTGNENFSKNYLWTIRSAVYSGDDINLPRLVGAECEEAKKFADKLLEELGNKGIVLYYPYFLAYKRGTLNVYSDRIIIEAVKKDLWNLVTKMDRDVTIQICNDEKIIDGNRDFLSKSEIDSLLQYVNEVRYLFRDDIIEGKSILLEWSFAKNCNSDKEPIGDMYLIFYEVRTI